MSSGISELTVIVKIYKNLMKGSNFLYLKFYLKFYLKYYLKYH